MGSPYTERAVLAQKEFNTFSIVARCAHSAQLGVAVATAVPAVGATCPHVRTDVGAACSQAWTNPYLARHTLDRIGDGATVQAALDATLNDDPERDRRQIGVVGRDGQVAVWTGADCTPWCGHATGDGFSVQGNMLTGPEVLDAMVAAIEKEAEDLAERLLRALEAGQAAGGDKRGQQSAALIVVAEEDYPLLDLRVDEHQSPIAELRRVLGIARRQLAPFVAAMPGKTGPKPLPQSVTDMLSLPPPARPGGGGSRR